MGTRHFHASDRLEGVRMEKTEETRTHMKMTWNCSLSWASSNAANQIQPPARNYAPPPGNYAPPPGNYVSPPGKHVSSNGNYVMHVITV